MNRITLTAAACLAIAACTPQQQVAAIQLAAAALPCYEAISAATQAGTVPVKILTGASVAALDPACKALDTASLTLIASAINSRSQVVAAPVSAPASGPVPAARHK